MACRAPPPTLLLLLRMLTHLRHTLPVLLQGYSTFSCN